MTYKVYFEDDRVVVKPGTDPDAFVGEIESLDEEGKLVVEWVYVEAANEEEAIQKARELSKHQP